MRRSGADVDAFGLWGVEGDGKRADVVIGPYGGDGKRAHVVIGPYDIHYGTDNRANYGTDHGTDYGTNYGTYN